LQNITKRQKEAPFHIEKGLQTVNKVTKMRCVIIAIDLYRMAKVTLAKAKPK